MLGKVTDKYKWWKNEWKKYKNIPSGINVVNLGSSMSYYDFDYQYWDNSRWCGFNMASVPQTIEYDYRVLQQYSSKLSEDCIVIISLSEFGFLVDRYDEDMYNYKYYGYLKPSLIDGHTRYKGLMIKCMPGLLYNRLLSDGFKRVIKKIIRYKGRMHVDDDDIKHKSENMLEGWKKEFGWEKEFALNKDQMSCIKKTRDSLDAIFSFVKKKGWSAVVVIPPFPKSLISILPQKILRVCLWDEIERIKRNGIQVLDYTKDPKLTMNSCFDSAIALNEFGKKLFNNSVELRLSNL